jgi:drug/metabolite transporter (DMT)-like permease
MNFPLALAALVFALIATAFGQILFKLYFAKKNIYILGLALGLFIVTPALSFIAQMQLPLDVVYMSTASTYIMVLFLSRFFLHETISYRQILGALVIASGIIIYYL